MDKYDMDHNPIGFMEAAMLLADGEKRQIALTSVTGRDESDVEWCVSTVFMPWDMSMGRSGVPVLYESMVFDGDGEIRKVERYPTRDGALAGHDRLCAWVRAPEHEDLDTSILG